MRENILNKQDNNLNAKESNLFICGILLAVVISIIGVVMLGKGLNIPEFVRTEEEQLLIDTPLNNYHLFLSSEKFTKFQLEAAQMVESLIAEGKTTEEACEEALLWMSDTIYNDYQEFRSNYPNVIEDIEAFHSDYEAYIAETQAI